MIPDKKIQALIADLRLNHEFCPKEVILQAADVIEYLTDRCDELAADKGTYFRLYEALCNRVDAAQNKYKDSE